MRKAVSLELMLAFMCLMLMVVSGLIPGEFSKYVVFFEPMLFLTILAGILSGWFFGTAVGVLAPLCLYFLIQGEVFMPDTVSSMIVYGMTGLFSGAVYKALHQPIVASAAAILAGRIALAASGLAFSFAGGRTYTITHFIEDGFIHCIGALLMCLLLIPLLHLLFKKAGVMSVLNPKFDYTR